MIPTVRRPLIVVLSLAAVSCAHAKIQNFSADPQQICRGQATTLAWQTVGESTLEADTDMPGMGAVASTGERSVSPSVTTTFTLRVHRGKDEAFARQEVVVYDTAPEVPLSISTEPDGDTAVTARIEVPARNWDDALRITDVSNPSDRAVEASHGGRTVSIAAGATSHAFAGLVMSGSWSLHAGLLPGEVMGDPEHAPPDHLELRVTLDCGN